MKIEKQFLDDHQAKLIVEADPDKLESAKKRAARKIARRIKIPGFRPGKAPYPVILRHVGEGAVIEEAMEFLVDEIYPEVLEEAEITPYGPGSLENITSLDPPILEFVVPLEAEVTLGDYHSVQETYEPADISEVEVDKVLEDLRERQALLEPVDRPSQEGDSVSALISAKRVKIEDDQDAQLIEERTHQIMIKKESDLETDPDGADEWPFSGFSRQLIGLSANDEKEIAYQYPDDEISDRFKGVDALFHVKVESVKVRILPDLDDEFATGFGEFENLAGLRSEIRTTLESQAKQAYDDEYDQEILDRVIELSTIKYPPQMLEHEIDNVVNNLKSRLNQQGIDLDLYLKMRSMDMEGIREEAIPIAESRLKQSLVLLEIAKVEDINVDVSQVQSEAQNTMSYVTQSLSKREARRLTERNVYETLVGNITMDRLMKKSMAKLREICGGIVEDENLVEETEVVEAAIDADDDHSSTEQEALPSAEEDNIETEEVVEAEGNEDEDNKPAYSEDTNQDDTELENE